MAPGLADWFPSSSLHGDWWTLDTPIFSINEWSVFRQAMTHSWIAFTAVSLATQDKIPLLNCAAIEIYVSTCSWMTLTRQSVHDSIRGNCICVVAVRPCSPSPISKAIFPNPLFPVVILMAESWEDPDALKADVLLAAMEENKERHRGQLFDFRLTLGTDRRLQRFGLRRRVFDTTLHTRTDLLCCG